MHPLARFEEYLRYERNFSDHTITAYRNDLAALGRFLLSEAQLELDDTATLPRLHRDHLRAFLTSADLKKTSVRRRISTLRTFFRFCVRQGWIDTSPAARLVMPKTDRRLAQFVREDALSTLLDGERFDAGFPGRRDRLVLELLYGCGLRRAELLALRWDDIRPDQTLRVLGKGRKERLVPFGPPVAAALADYRAALATEGFPAEGTLLLANNGSPFTANQLYSRVRHHLRAIPGLAKTSPHVLRHSYATHLVNHGANLNAVKELLGHASLAATQVYVHNSISRLRESYRKAHPRADDAS